MSQYQYDPEMMADLYYKISKEFMESPDERITWLESLAETHRAVSNCCNSHSVSFLTSPCSEQTLGRVCSN
jgi:hypothetical protein